MKVKIWQKAALCVCAQSVVGWLAAKVNPVAVIPAVAAVGAAGYLLCKHEKKTDVFEPVAAEEAVENICETIVEDVLVDDEPVCEESEVPVKLSYNVAESRDFARWVQLFALHVKRSGNNNLRNLYEGLKSELELMDIFVYDEIETDEEGNVILPNENYFIDMRTDEAWTDVTLPIVYNSERALMHGQIE